MAKKKIYDKETLEAFKRLIKDEEKNIKSLTSKLKKTKSLVEKVRIRFNIDISKLQIKGLKGSIKRGYDTLSSDKKEAEEERKVLGKYLKDLRKAKEKEAKIKGLSGVKSKPRKKKSVKNSSCRTAGHQMNSKNKTMRKVGAKKLGSKTCKTKAQIKKSTSKIAKISKLAKKIRKPNEKWQTALKRASKLV